MVSFVHQKGKGIGELHHVLVIVIYHNTYHDHDPTSICTYEVLIFNSTGTGGNGHDIHLYLTLVPRPQNWSVSNYVQGPRVLIHTICIVNPIVLPSLSSQGKVI